MYKYENSILSRIVVCLEAAASIFALSIDLRSYFGLAKVLNVFDIVEVINLSFT